MYNNTVLRTTVLKTTILKTTILKTIVPRNPAPDGAASGKQSCSRSKLGISALVVAMAAGGAMAQEAGGQQARGSLLDEIVVRARKKAEGEAVQDTPIAMTAFGEQQFKAIFADDLGDLGMMSPNVELKPSAQVGNQNFTIRGMGVSGTTPSDSPAVGVFQNGVFWGVNYGSLLDTFDVESVEILRGPQGTLFGRNVTGGAVVVRTKRPDGEFGFEAEAVYGDYGRRDIAGSIQGALVEDVLAGRLSVLERRLDGYYDNLEQGGRDFGESDSTVVRGTLVLTPTDNFDATLIVERYEEDGDSVAAKGIETPGDLPYQNGYREPSNWWDLRLDNPGVSDIEVDSLTLEMNWDIGHGVITSITGYRDLSVYNHTDFDGSGFSGFNQSIDMEQDQFSQEIRYASTFSDWMEFTVGAYYFEQEHDFREGRALNNGLSGLFASGNHLEQDSQAVFGEVDFRLNDQWTLTVGGRYTREDIKAQTVPFGGCPLDESIASPELRIRKLSLSCDLGPTGKEDWSDFSPKLGLAWTPDEHQLAYVTATRGFRSGGFSMRGNALLPPFDSEEVTALELGYKGDWLDNRLRINAAIYHNEYDDLQRTILVPSGTGVTQSTGNAAQATISGLEIDVIAQVTERLMVTLAYGYTDASFDKYDGFDVTGDGTPDPGLAKNLDFTRVPDESYSGSVMYEQPLGELGHLSFRIAGTKTASQYFDDRNTILEPAYVVWDASVTYSTPADSWKISLFGKNLGNEEYAYWGSSLGALGANRFLGAPRTAGIKVSYQY